MADPVASTDASTDEVFSVVSTPLLDDTALMSSGDMRELDGVLPLSRVCQRVDHLKFVFPTDKSILGQS